MGLGVIGLSLQDFDALTPFEFDEVYRAFDKYNTEVSNFHYRASWSRTRFIVKAIFQVNSKKAIKDNDIIEFVWEKPEEIIAVENNSKEAFEKAITKFSDVK